MAVLCTSSATFEIKEAEISNSMLITPQLAIGQDVEDSGTQNIQVAKVRRLVSILIFIFAVYTVTGNDKRIKFFLLETNNDALLFKKGDIRDE